MEGTWRGSRLSALHLAIKEDNYEQFAWLLEQGVEVNLPDEHGDTPLLLAAEGHLYSSLIEKMLERGAALSARNRAGMTPLMLALDGNNLELVQMLLAWHQRRGEPAEINPNVEGGRMALFFAVFNNDLAALGDLLDVGANIEVRNQWERTPLMLAAQLGRKEALRLLLERGADIRAGDYGGTQALSVAADNGHTECIRLLLDYGADPDAKDISGWTPLIWLASGRDAPDAARMLLEHGANVQAQSKEGMTALQQAAWNGVEETVGVLLEWGAGEDQQALQRAFRASYVDNGQNRADVCGDARRQPDHRTVAGSRCGCQRLRCCRHHCSPTGSRMVVQESNGVHLIFADRFFLFLADSGLRQPAAADWRPRGAPGFWRSSEPSVPVHRSRGCLHRAPAASGPQS
jgi:ankyrin repeat protein